MSAFGGLQSNSAVGRSRNETVIAGRESRLSANLGVLDGKTIELKSDPKFTFTLTHTMPL